MNKEAPRGLERMKDFILHPLGKRPPTPRKDRHTREAKTIVYKTIDPENPDRREAILSRGIRKIELVQELPHPEETLSVAQPDPEAMEIINSAITANPFMEMSPEELSEFRKRSRGHWSQDPQAYEPDLDNIGYSDEDHFPGLGNPR